MIFPQLKFDINNEIITDNFAGGGCVSTGIEMLPRTLAAEHFAVHHEVIE